MVTQQLVAGSETEAAAAYGSAPELGRHFLNDVVFTEPARWLAQAHAERSPSYLYRFSIANEKIRSTYGGALHGDDFHFVFGHGDQTVANSDELAAQMAQCWVSFARTGTPECGDVDWPQADDGAFVDFTNDGPVVVDDDPWQARLDLVTDLYARAVADGVPASP